MTWFSGDVHHTRSRRHFELVFPNVTEKLVVVSISFGQAVTAVPFKFAAEQKVSPHASRHGSNVPVPQQFLVIQNEENTNIESVVTRTAFCGQFETQ